MSPNSVPVKAEVSPSTGWARIYATGPLITLCLALGWLAIYLMATGRHDAGILTAGAASLVALLTLRRGRIQADQRKEVYRTAYLAASARNRELDRLRQLAASLLSGTDLEVLFEDIARAAAELLEADAGVITLIVEEGRFLRIAAASGTLRGVTGSLLPAEGSLSGWVLAHEEPLVSDDMENDPRCFHLEHQGTVLRTAAIIPLRSADLVIGTVSVHNRRDGRPFGPHDLQLLRALGDQAVMGLDRATVLEESRASERALAAKNRELQRATQLKSDFLANMSHELRTPLNAIIGFSELILTEGTGPVNEQQRDFLEAVLRNGRHLLSLIGSILDLSKIEAGRMALELALTDLRETLLAAVADTESLRAAKRQECMVQIGEKPITLLADGQRIRQIFFNLLANASKFTPDGGRITVSAVITRAPLPVPAERAGEEPRLVTRDAAWVSVIDTGIGIREEDRDKLFREFSQVDASSSRRSQGTGLGLALSRQFVEMHGGIIGADSIPGTGSSFWFILPVEGPIRRAIHSGS